MNCHSGNSQKARKQTPVSLPVPFKLTHVGHHWGPVEGPRLLLQPLLQLLQVALTVVTDNDLLEGFTSREELVDGGARADVDQEVPLHAIWFRGGKEGGGQVSLQGDTAGLHYSHWHRAREP